MSRRPRRSAHRAPRSLTGVVVEGRRRRSRVRRLIAIVATFALALSGLLVLSAPPAGAADFGPTRPFTPVFTANTTGDVIIRGNSLETCQSGSVQAQGSVTCADAQGGVPQQNNNYFMTYIDADGSTGNSTFDSSSAMVNVPDGATVLYAGLSWGASTTAGALKDYPLLTGVAAPDVSLIRAALFKAPGATDYSPVTSSTTDINAGNYQAYADVTSAVKAAGKGTYSVANVQAGTGGNSYAGWSLVVAFSDPTMPTRNLTVFTGYNQVSTATPSVDIPVSGFQTPATGAVSTKVGVVAYEGDKGAPGDGMSVGGTSLYNALNPINDVFNSSLTDMNVAITDRSPSYANMLGFDIDRLDATGILPNGATSTTVHLTTAPVGGEFYYPGMLTFATDLYASGLTATKTVTDVTSGGGTVSRNDRLKYSVTVTNGGADGAAATVLTDAAPAGTTYATGSLKINGAPVTDAVDTDTGDVSGGNVTARLGTGATSSAGGLLAQNNSATVSFEVYVNFVADGTALVNTALFTNRNQTTGAGYSGGSNTVTSTVIVPPALTGTLAGGELTAPYSSGFTLGSGTGTGPYVWTISSGPLPAGLSINSATGLITGTPTATGSFPITVLVTDANNRTGTATGTIVVAAGPAVVFAPPTGYVGVAYTAQPTASGGAGPYTWAVSTGTLPAGLTINATTGAITGTPTTAGATNITVKATDSKSGTATQAGTITIAVVPTLTGTLPAGEVTAPYSSGFTVNGGVSPFVWTVSSGPLPTGLSINSATGIITGTPTATGSFPITVQATDTNGKMAPRSQTITVTGGPTVAFTPLGGEVGVAYTAQPTASGGTPSYTWSVSTGTLPAGLSINTTTGAITGTPAAAGTSNVTVQATDAANGTASAARTITIVAAPTLTGTLPGGELTAPYSGGFTVNDGTGPFVFSISTGTLPAGLTINTSTGLITGTATATGSTTITVRVTDAKGSTTTRDGTILVTAGPAVAFSPPTGEVGVAYTAQPTATGGTGPYTWSLSVGTLPAGLSINTTTGAITGTPTAPGSSNITVKATDAANGTATQAGTITIVAAPTVTFSPPTGEVGVAYTAQPTASGGTGSYTWSLSAGTLPAGLSINTTTGAITGTPTAPGSSNITVKATDAANGTGIQTGTIVVNKTTSTITVAVPATARFGTAITITVAVGPSTAGGTVTFTDVPTTGPQAGTTVTLGTGPVSGGAASLTVTLPAFGVNTVKATYSGDANNAAATSTTTQVEVSAYAGEVIVTEFRTSGPNGANDSYVELLNTGPPVPLAGMKITADSGAVSTLPATAGTLGTGRSYLLTGSAYSLGAQATSDYSTTIGTGGVKVTAPDTVGTQTDAVGPSGGFHLGTAGLPAMTGTPTAQWAWVRSELAGAAVNTSNNSKDFQLVSTTLDAVGGVQPTLGSASPTGTADPYQHNAALQSTLLDTGKDVAVAPNREVVSGTPRHLVIRRTITNTTGQTITAAKVRVSALSEQYGALQPGVANQPASRVWLRAINPSAATEQVTLTSGATVTVQNLSVDAPNSGGLGGGLNSTFTVPLPGGGLAPGAKINVAFTFAVDTGGTFWFGYDVDAK